MRRCPDGGRRLVAISLDESERGVLLEALREFHCEDCPGLNMAASNFLMLNERALTEGRGFALRESEIGSLKKVVDSIAKQNSDVAFVQVLHGILDKLDGKLGRERGPTEVDAQREETKKLTLANEREFGGEQ